jgi:hypothetical protein
MSPLHLNQLGTPPETNWLLTALPSTVSGAIRGRGRRSRDRRGRVEVAFTWEVPFLVGGLGFGKRNPRSPGELFRGIPPVQHWVAEYAELVFRFTQTTIDQSQISRPVRGMQEAVSSLCLRSEKYPATERWGHGGEHIEMVVDEGVEL